jgi:hypothetical protein
MQITPQFSLTQPARDWHLDFIKPHDQKAARLLLDWAFTKYRFLDQGNYRAVFKMRGDYVLKIPLNEAGVYCNDGEGSIKDEIYARGRWIELNGLVCVIQEYVEDASLSDIRSRFGSIPDWVSGIDCAQVGFTRSGALKAYDFVHP